MLKLDCFIRFKVLIFIALVLFENFSFAQNTRWEDYFSYFDISKIEIIGDELYSATEGGLFSYNINNNEISKISKVNGLSGVVVTGFSYNDDYQTFLIGYEGGMFDVFTPDGISLNVDLIIDNDFQGNKSIKHISNSGDYAVLSMDFGVLYFNIPRKEVSETIYFRQLGSYIKVKESIIYGDEIYAITSEGIYSKNIDFMLPNFSEWSHDFSGVSFDNICEFNGQLLASSGNTIWIKSDVASSWQVFGTQSNLKDLVSENGFLSVVSLNSVTVYDENLNLVHTNTFGNELNTGVYISNTIYAGTSLYGLIDENNNQYAPDGPYKNKSFTVNTIDDKIWISSGGVSSFTVDDNTDYGYYYYDGLKWNHISSSFLNGANNIMDVIPNPNNLDEVYVICYDYGREGIIKVENQASIEVFNHLNSVISEPNHLVSGIFDDSGNLFVSERDNYLGGGAYGHAIIALNATGSFSKIDLNSKNISPSPRTAISKPIIDNKGFLYVAGPRDDGVIVLDYNKTPLNQSDDKLYLISTDENQGNLPSNNAVCVELDNSGDLWIGLVDGLRVLQNPRDAVTQESFATKRVVIEENGVGEELLREIQVNDIATDKANRKWIATENSGVFYVSPDGSEVYKNFTITNSPLPTNTIRDIAINHDKGIVYFATTKGTVSYKSDVSIEADDFSNVLVYPNPVRPNYSGNVIIRNLMDNATIKITNIVGDLVYEARSEGGVVEWNQQNLQGKKVASGIYIIFMTNFDGTKTSSKKIAIVR